MPKKKISLIGCGAIGTALAREIPKRLGRHFEIAYVADLVESRARALARRLASRPQVVSSRDALLRAHLAIECASQQAACDLAMAALRLGKDLVVLSAGGLLQIPNLKKRLARARGKIFVPSGAIGGVDVMRAARLDSLRRVTLTTRKPLRTLAGAPFFRGRVPALSRAGEWVLFEGTARQAARLFPASVNVGAVASLAGLGPDKTRVRVVATRGGRRNRHALELSGAFGKVSMSFENTPLAGNPRTSRLAVLSVITLLENFVSPLKIGS